MNKVNKSGVPALRFPEFKNAPVWGEKKLGDYLDYLQPTKYLVESTAYNDNYKIPVLTAGKTFILGYTNEINGIFENNLPVIIFDDFTTATKFVDLPFKAKSSAMKILLAKDNANIKFIYELMQTIEHEVGNHQRHWISKFSTLNVFIPKPKEQQKIADCLTSLDDLITAQSQKVDSLKQHKKGLMQQLFPQADTNRPKLRFPEFKNSPVWEEKKLGDISKISTGKLDANAMVANGKYRFYTCAKNYYRIDKYAFNTESLLISGNGANVGYIHYYNGKFNAYQRTYVLDKFTKNISFIKYYLEQKLSKRIKDEKKEGNTPYIVKSTLSEMIIMLPSNKLEQQKIADCLTSLDELIDAQSQKMAALKQHKKGLMQQLFPVAN